jgi:hypothetical protein
LFAVSASELLKQFENWWFYVSPYEKTFNVVTISVAFISKFEAVATAGIVQGCCTLDEKHSSVDGVFLAQFMEIE